MIVALVICVFLLLISFIFLFKISLEKKHEEKIYRIQREAQAEAKETMKNEFEVLSQKILEEKKASFEKESQKDIANLLNPLGKEIKEFSEKLEKNYVEQKTELGILQKQSSNMSVEAAKLTKALRGDGKIQGDWGEVILERLLEKSGLRKGQEYETQESFRVPEGRRQPDVIIYLPGEKHLIIDAKISLTAWYDYINSEEEKEKEKHLKKHFESVQRHIKNLDCKDYTKIEDLDVPDFLFLFFGNEASLSIVKQEIFSTAWEKGICLVSPSTLFPIIQIVSNLWAREKQSRNAEEIIKLATKFYDKLSLFNEKFLGLKHSIENTQKKFEEAQKTLGGQGGLNPQAAKIRELGIQKSKPLPFNEQVLEEFSDSEGFVEQNNNEIRN